MRYGLKPDDFEKVKRKNLVAAIIYFLSGAFVFCRKSYNRNGKKTISLRFLLTILKELK